MSGDMPGVQVNEADCEVLCVIAECAEAAEGFHCAPVAISRRQFGEYLDVRKAEPTRVIARCVQF